MSIEIILQINESFVIFIILLNISSKEESFTFINYFLYLIGDPTIFEFNNRTGNDISTGSTCLS